MNHLREALMELQVSENYDPSKWNLILSIIQAQFELQGKSKKTKKAFVKLVEAVIDECGEELIYG